MFGAVILKQPPYIRPLRDDQYVAEKDHQSQQPLQQVHEKVIVRERLQGEAGKDHE